MVAFYFAISRNLSRILFRILAGAVIVLLGSAGSSQAFGQTCQDLFFAKAGMSTAQSGEVLEELARLYLELHDNSAPLHTSLMRQWQKRYRSLSESDRTVVRNRIGQISGGEETSQTSESNAKEPKQKRKNLLASEWPKARTMFVHGDAVSLKELTDGAGPNAYYDVTPGKRLRSGIQWSEQGRYVAVRATHNPQTTKVYDLQLGRVLDLPGIGFLTREGNYFVEPRGEETIYHELATGKTQGFKGVPRYLAEKFSDHYFLASDVSASHIELVNVTNGHRIDLGPRLAFSLAGDKIAYFVQSEIRVVNLKTGQVSAPVPGRLFNTYQGNLGGSVWELTDIGSKQRVLFDVASERLFDSPELNDDDRHWYHQKNTHFLHLEMQEPVPNPAVIPHAGEFYNFVTGERFQYDDGKMSRLFVRGRPMALIADDLGKQATRLISLEDHPASRVLMELAPGFRPLSIGDLVYQNNGDEILLQTLHQSALPIHVPDLKGIQQVRALFPNWALALVDLNVGRAGFNSDYYALDMISGTISPMNATYVNVSPDLRWQWVMVGKQLELQRFENEETSQ